MTKKIERVYRDRVSPRLTVTPDRITMKFPNDYPEKYPPRNIVEKFFLEIAKRLDREILSYRGVFFIPSGIIDESPMERSILLTMYSNGKRFYRTFKISEATEIVEGPLSNNIKAEDAPAP